MEIMILNAIQSLRTPWLDTWMVGISSLGDYGAVWILLALLLLLFPKYRKVGLLLAASLAVELILCNVLLKPLVARAPTIFTRCWTT